MDAENTVKETLPLKLFLGIFLTALILRLLFCFYFSSLPAASTYDYFTDSDMQANKLWAEKILDDDLLGEDTFHPYTDWMKKIASQKQWEKWWGGGKIFQQAPLYPYFLAFNIAITNNHKLYPRLIQSLTGAFTVLILTIISFKLYGKKASLITGILSFLYYPFYFFEYFYLRDFLALHLLCWVLLSFVLFFKSENHNPFYIFMTGIFISFSIMVRENMLILLPFFFMMFLTTKDISSKVKFFDISIFCLAVIIGLSPLLYRNYTVQAPLFSLSNRLIEGLIEGLSYDSTPVFMCLPESMDNYLNQGEGKILATLKMIINDYPDFLSFVKRVCQKFFWNLFYLEPFNNINLYFLKKYIPPFTFFPGYPFIFLFLPLAFLSLLKEKKLYFFFLWLLIFLSLGLPPVLARYRLILIPFYLLWIGAALKELLSFEKKFLISALLIILFILSLSLDLFLPERYAFRPTEEILLKRINEQKTDNHI